MLTEADMRNILRHRCEAAGGQKAWGEANMVSPQYVCDILNGRKEVSTNVAMKLGYERKVVFLSCHTPDNVA